jgi:hypothetical protein
MTLSNLCLLTTNVEHNDHKKERKKKDNGFFFLQAFYGQINIEKRMIL